MCLLASLLIQTLWTQPWNKQGFLKPEVHEMNTVPNGHPTGDQEILGKPGTRALLFRINRGPPTDQQ